MSSEEDLQVERLRSAVLSHSDRINGVKPGHLQNESKQRVRVLKKHGLIQAPASRKPAQGGNSTTTLASLGGGNGVLSSYHTTTPQQNLLNKKKVPNSVSAHNLLANQQKTV